MNKETLQALEESIKHWQEDPGPFEGQNCALCKRFGSQCEKLITRERCPVYEETGLRGCGDTPYLFTPTPAQQGKEVKFLQSLLPDDEPTGGHDVGV